MARKLDSATGCDFEKIFRKARGSTVCYSLILGLVRIRCRLGLQIQCTSHPTPASLASRSSPLLFQLRVRGLDVVGAEDDSRVLANELHRIFIRPLSPFRIGLDQ